jgi:phosphatidate phosphatase APP1
MKWHLKYVLSLSLEDLNDLLDSPNDSNDIVHQLISIYSFYLQFAVALHTLLVVSLLAAQTVVVSTGNDGYWIVQLMAKRTLNLGNYSIVQLLQPLQPFL